jgi:Uncharacterized protein conserved in bacteria
MTQKKWRGTILFLVVLTVMGLTAGLRLYGSGLHPAAAVSVSAPPTTAAAATPPTTASGATSAARSTAAPAAPATKSIAGAVEQTPYGPIQVSVTFTGTKITAVKELQSPNDRDLSVQINANAAPILAQEVLTSQSARIDTVSGASYTSQGYAQSVQSAIDKL